jgi:hypothetical protein
MSTTLFTYCIPYDDGAAPNPFWGLCTLAICKPSIRRVAKEGDWVVGTGSVPWVFARRAHREATDESPSFVWHLRDQSAAGGG